MILQQADPFKVHGLKSPLPDCVNVTLLQSWSCTADNRVVCIHQPSLGDPGVHSWTRTGRTEREIMTQERLWQVLDLSWRDPCILSALLCSSAAAVVLLKWLERKQIQQKMEEARRMRDLALERMEKAARRFKQEVIWGKVCVRKGWDCILGNQRNGGVVINPFSNGGWGMCTFWIIGKFFEGHHPPLSQKNVL